MNDYTIVEERIRNKELDSFFADLYGTNAVEKQRERYLGAIEGYIEEFGHDFVEIYSAPGRTEMGGNHTDHQHGMVLAASVDMDTIAVVGKNEKNRIEVFSEGYGLLSVDLEHIEKDEKMSGTTFALVQGVVAGMKQRGIQVGPFKAYMTSNVLSGAGLSSSAAFETVIGTILSGLYNEGKISPVDIAVIGQYAENVYFGKPCGLMDQMACSVGGIVHIDFENPSKPIVNTVEFDMEEKGYSLCIVDTKGSHADLTDDYAAVPREMKEVAALFGKEALREVPEQEFFDRLPEIRRKAGDRAVLRTIHFLEENKRVRKQVDALKENDFDEFLELVKQSGDSSYKYLQNIYSNHQEQNQPISVALAYSECVLKVNGVSRVHGGGFAGTIQAFVKNETVSDYQDKMEHLFGKGSCHVLRIRKYGGVKVV